MIESRSLEASAVERRPSSTADEETIVAISTPPGRGGVGVVRLSGSRAGAVAAELFRPARSGALTAAPGQAVYGRFVDSEGQTIDTGYLVLFRGPATFTGEEVAEMWAHGSPAALRLLVLAAVDRGARPATPGEFTLRAFLNGKIDVTQAEAIRDLIEARTAFQAKVAHDQVRGRISDEVNRIKNSLADLMARLEAAIEFGEEAEASRFLPEGIVMSETRSLRGAVERLAGTYERGRRIREGVRVALIGSPNAGKSSLFNRLLEEERAIVTPVAGTTRDVLEETLDLGGVPVVLLDTAGIGEPRDEADAEAVRRARGALETCDLAVVVVDRSRALRDDDRALLGRYDRERSLVALNKMDLPCGIAPDERARLGSRYSAIEVSATSGQGIDTLRSCLAQAVGRGEASVREQVFITNVRHFDLLRRAAAALARTEEGCRGGVTDEYLLLDLHEALDRLGEITGAVGIDGIYERIFKNFCIGK